MRGWLCCTLSDVTSTNFMAQTGFFATDCGRIAYSPGVTTVSIFPIDDDDDAAGGGAEPQRSPNQQDHAMYAAIVGRRPDGRLNRYALRRARQWPPAVAVYKFCLKCVVRTIPPYLRQRSPVLQAAYLRWVRFDSADANLAARNPSRRP